MRAAREVWPVRLASGRSRCGPSPKWIGPSGCGQVDTLRPPSIGLFCLGSLPNQLQSATAISDSILVAPLSTIESRHGIGPPGVASLFIVNSSNTSASLSLRLPLFVPYTQHKSLNHAYECKGIRMAQVPRCCMTRPVGR